MALTIRQRSALLRAARKAVEAAAAGAPHQDQSGTRFPGDGSGVFVTLRSAGELRGCIGFTEPERPLQDSVVMAAVRAATEDFRFPPVRPDELDSISIEISVISGKEEIASDAEISIGTHGLIVEHGSGKRGLLLPQVAALHDWDAETFLRETFRKGSIDPESGGSTVYRFTAEIFSDR